MKKHVSQIATKVLSEVSQLDSQRPSEFLPADEPKKPREHPLRTPWQKKWLDLEVTHPDIQHMADRVTSLASRWFKRQAPMRWLVVVGSVGTGKSRCCRALFRWAAQAAFTSWTQKHWPGDNIPRVIYIEWLTIASPEKCADKEFEQIVEEAEKASLVIIDDIGTETDQFRTNVPTQRLCHLLNRIERNYALITTNVKESAWSSTWDVRVEDRLLAADVIEVNAPSYRSEI